MVAVSTVSFAGLAANRMLQLDKPTGGKTIFEEQKQLHRKSSQPRSFDTPGLAPKRLMNR